MYEIENQLYDEGYEYICGIDEAGRGPLAGCVTAAAVILPRGCVIDGINDSKKLSQRKREKLFDVITHEAICYAIATASHDEVDAINVLQASLLAMKRATLALSTTPDILIVDGNQLTDFEVEARAVVGGDGLSVSIAAASILAKVSRDRYMVEMDTLYPSYGFAKHKGYGTTLHYKMINEHGICDIHRRSFLKKIVRTI